MKRYERHPLSAAWPDMAADEFEDLKADIKANGLFHPVRLFEGKILDGWHRYQACQDVGASLRVEKFDGNEIDAAAYARAANGRRRNTTASQRALAYAEIAKWAERGRPDKSAPGADLNPSKNNELQNSTVRAAAEEARVSDRTMHQAKVVAEKGGAKLKDAVRAGEVSVKKASAVVDLPKSEQLAAAKRPVEEKQKASADPMLSPDWAPDEDEDAALELAEKDWKDRLDKVMAADDKLAEARKQIEQQAAIIAALTIARDGFMNGRKAAIATVKERDRRIASLERQLKRARAA